MHKHKKIRNSTTIMMPRDHNNNQQPKRKQVFHSLLENVRKCACLLVCAKLQIYSLTLTHTHGSFARIAHEPLFCKYIRCYTYTLARIPSTQKKVHFIQSQLQQQQHCLYTKIKYDAIQCDSAMLTKHIL